MGVRVHLCERTRVTEFVKMESLEKCDSDSTASFSQSKKFGSIVHHLERISLKAMMSHLMKLFQNEIEMA